MNAPIRVAIVDDDALLAGALANLMRSAGFVAVVFSSAEQFLESRRTSAIDVLLTDYELPGTDGIRMIHMLRAGGDLIPAILMTAHDSPALRGHALAAGATDFLSKPFDADELILAIEACASRKTPGSNGAA